MADSKHSNWERMCQPDGTWFWRNAATGITQYHTPPVTTATSTNAFLKDIYDRLKRLEAHQFEFGTHTIKQEEVLYADIAHHVKFKTPFETVPVVCLNSNNEQRASVTLGVVRKTGFDFYVNIENYKDFIRTHPKHKKSYVTVRWSANAVDR